VRNPVRRGNSCVSSQCLAEVSTHKNANRKTSGRTTGATEVLLPLGEYASNNTNDSDRINAIAAFSFRWCPCPIVPTMTILLGYNGSHLLGKTDPTAIKTTAGCLIRPSDWPVHSIWVRSRVSSLKFPPVMRMRLATTSGESGPSGSLIPAGAQRCARSSWT
jgi:hypothetical protein